MSRYSLRFLQFGLMSALALLAGPVFALHANQSAELPLDRFGSVSFAIEGSILGVEGEAHEIVYMESGSDLKLSELIWDIESLVMAGGSLSVDYSEALGRIDNSFVRTLSHIVLGDRLNVGMWMNVTEGTGSMEDYDWLGRPTTSAWTDYSESGVDIDLAYSFDINTAWDLPQFGPFVISSLIGYKRNYWEWSDYGGTYIYSSDPSSPTGFRDQRGTFGADVGIDYDQTFHIPYGGIQVAAEWSRVRASVYLLYSPFVMAVDHDYHYSGNRSYREEFSGGDYFAAGLDLSVNLTKSLFISGAIDAQEIPTIRGDLYQSVAGGQEMSYPDSAGIKNSVIAASLSIGYRL